MPRYWLSPGGCLVVAALAILPSFARCGVADEKDPRPSATTLGSSPLSALIDELWEYDLRENPLHATRVGDHRFDGLLPRVSLKDSDRRNSDRVRFLKRLQSLDDKHYSPDDRLNATILELLLQQDIAEHGFGTHLIPITNREGFHIEFPELRRQVPLKTADDFRNYIARLAGFRKYCDGHIALMRSGLQQGMTLPAVVLAGYEAPIEAQLSDRPEKSLLYEPFVRLPNNITKAEAQKLRAAGVEAIRESVFSGYRRFLKFMRQEYVPRARDSIAAANLPKGREFYRHRVRMFTTLDLTPEQVHDTGLREVARIRAEMEVVKARADFSGSLEEFFAFLRSDPQFYATTPVQLLAETALVLKRMDGELPKLFRTLPRVPYGIREIPAYVAPLTTTAYYQPPPGDATDAGYYYVNTFNLKSRPLYEIEALSLHEAVPGHHLQIALQQELPRLPNFRRYAGFTAYVEGWALYAERLGMEVGFYQDPYRDFGRLTFEMWRACRLVVDTGMHALGWTRDQAIEFMEQNTALSQHNIRAEVDRYIAWPGQALGYKIGELKIRELRERAEKELGPVFDVRDFHDAILTTGAVPLSLLEAQIEEYIATKKSKS